MTPVESKEPSKPETPAKVESKELTPVIVPIPELKPEPKPEAKIEPKPELKPEPKIEIKPEAKVEPKPEVKIEPKPEAKVESKPEVKPETKIEVKPEPKVESKIEPKVDPKPETKVEAPVIPVPAPEDKKPAAPAPAPEPAKPEAPASSGGWLRGMLRRSDADTTPKPEPLAVAAKTEIPAPKPEEKKPVTPAPVEAVKTPAPEQKPLVEIPPSAPKAGGTPPAPATPAPTPVSVPTPAPVAATPKPEVSVTTSQPKMAQPESTTNVPANSRASAQLTLGFEITSLQLTPFFKLGAVQLKPLSNVVGLHLIATQAADNPLAAGISFQIDKVELNNDKLSAITLKPLQDAQAAAVPQSKLQVDAVQIGQGSDGAPISVTSSGAASTAVQLLATFTIAAMEFTPAFEIGLLRLEPTSNSVLLRLAPSSRPASLDLPAVVRGRQRPVGRQRADCGHEADARQQTGLTLTRSPRAGSDHPCCSRLFVFTTIPALSLPRRACAIRPACVPPVPPRNRASAPSIGKPVRGWLPAMRGATPAPVRTPR